jgi:branched-subunit amino acid ABC-type transport system permease component
MTNFIGILIRGLMLGSVYALVGMGLTLVWGVVGIVNIAHGEFVMLGAYFAFWAFRFESLRESPLPERGEVDAFSSDHGLGPSHRELD